MNHKDHDWLYEHYVIDEMSTLEIGEMCGITSKRVCAWLSKHEIKNRQAPISKVTHDLIRAAYETANVNNIPLNLSELATVAGHSKSTICRCARSMGITNNSRIIGHTTSSRWTAAKIEFLTNNYKSMTYTELGEHIGFEECAIRRKLDEYGLKKSPSDMWKYHPHPRGMLGKHHSDAMSVATSKRVIRAWQDPNSAFNSDEFRQKKSDNMTRFRATHKQKNPYSRTRGGRREDLDNRYFRSAWEANFARYLNFLVENGDIMKWEYEPDTFEFIEIKRGTRSYTPDFKVFDSKDAEPYYYEVKGWMDAKSKTRLKRMAKYYPGVRVIVFGQKEYTSLKKSLAGLIPNWEHS